MKNMMKSGVAALALTIGANAATAEGELVLYHWFEYMPQELLDKFKAETGITVTMDTYDSNEAMLASLKAGGIGTYDVSVPGDYMVAIMAGEGMLDTIAEGELKNKGNISPDWSDPSFDPGRASSIPYQWGSTSFAVNRDAYDGDIQTTDILFNPPAELQGRINVLDSQGEVMALAAIHMGIPQCSTDREQLKALNAMLQEAKQHWASFNSDTAKEVLVSGDADVGMIYDGFAAKARQEKASVEYAFPTQGYVAWMDSVVLLKDAPNRDSALKFMDFLLEPENIAAVSNFARYNNGLTGTSEFLDPDLLAQPENNPPETAGPGVFIEVCDEQTQAVYDKIWTELKK
ncbi:extracellular solute-binding protein [Shimia marina]|uniref:Putrescine-binding periplasmic protein n=1 Tax=Shimia marina TaxID=321267 RepID=A0A0P1F9F7_9RHOB|nr:extracellular solute-binding protein [Shimia marina]CUH52085.1 Spermidine/putrescine-binding periplasmic protein precursor [Shimia marina]SFE63548.1 spermidine/putrescine transport system substrate-binding protein [Shimia marina]